MNTKTIIAVILVDLCVGVLAYRAFPSRLRENLSTSLDCTSRGPSKPHLCSGPVFNFQNQSARLDAEALDPVEDRLPIALALRLPNQVLSF